MAEQQCPFCDNPMDELERDSRDNKKHFNCEECSIELVKYPSSNKEGVQRTGLYAFIPLDWFSKDEWTTFLFEDENIYGETIPDRMPSFSSLEERKKVEEEREQKLQESREWEAKVS